MDTEVLLVKEKLGYRLLHGVLHLINGLRQSDEMTAVASGEGKVKVVKTKDGILVGDGRQKMPLLFN